MLRFLLKGVLGRVLGLALFGGGFLLLVKGFVDSSIALAVLGGAMIPVGMWVMALARKEWPHGQ